MEPSPEPGTGALVPGSLPPGTPSRSAPQGRANRFYTDGRFWLAQVGVLILWLARLTADLILGHGLAPPSPEFTTVALFLVPVLYVTLELELDGGLATTAWVAALTLPRALDYAHRGSPVGTWADLMQVLVLVVLASIVGTRVSAERDALARADAARAAHLAAEARYRELFSANAAPILLVDLESVIVEANRAAEEVFSEVPGSSLTGLALGDALGPDTAAAIWSAARSSALPAERAKRVHERIVAPATPDASGMPGVASRSEDAAGPGDASRSEDAGPGHASRSEDAASKTQPAVTRVDASGARRTFRARPTLLGGMGPSDGALLQVVLQDVTAETLRQESMEHFAASVLDAQEDERRRIAQELHDGPLQGLVYLCRQIDDSHAPPELRVTAQELVVELRNLARGLRPSVLDDLGLAASIKHLLSELESRCSVRTSFGVTGAPATRDPAAELAMFRVAQEALSNVERHANATSVAVGLSFDARGARLLVSDDGMGFDQESPPLHRRPGSLGITGMNERVGLLGGHLKVHAEHGTGTTVEAWIPVKRAAGK